MAFFSRISIAITCLGLLAAGPSLALSSDAAASGSGGALPGKNRAYASLGIEASVSAVIFKASRRALNIQLLLKNTRPEGIYLALVADPSSSGTTVQTSDGEVYTTAAGVVGFPYCNDPMTEHCIDQMTYDRYIYIEPGQSAPLGLNVFDAYQPSVPETISFSLKFVIRPAAGPTDALSTPGKMGPPAVVTLNLPLVRVDQ